MHVVNALVYTALNLVETKCNLITYLSVILEARNRTSTLAHVAFYWSTVS